jgi:hypothetical protein
MQQTKTYCDACGEEIKKGYGIDKGNLVLIGRPDTKETKVSRLVLEDLCHTCTAKLFSMINNFMEVQKK